MQTPGFFQGRINFQSIIILILMIKNYYSDFNIKKPFKPFDKNLSAVHALKITNHQIGLELMLCRKFKLDNIAF